MDDPGNGIPSVTASAALADTSLFSGREPHRRTPATMPATLAVSVITSENSRWASWIAATAIAYSLPLATQDNDHDDVPGLSVIKL